MVTALKKRYSQKAKFIFAFLLSLALAFPPLGPIFLPQAYAAPLTNYKVLISNSQASATPVTYTFNWTVSDNSHEIKQIDIQICTTPSGTCNAPAGFSAGNEPTLESENIAGTGNTVTSPTDNVFRVVVTTPAAQSTTAMYLNFTGVTNPSTINTTYYARAFTYSDTGTTVLDTSVTAFAILTTTSMAVSATVDTSFTFSVAGVSSGGNLNGGTGNIDETSTATTIPFGTLTTGTDEIAAHDLTISTNATNGYRVTASHSATIAGNPPLASGSANIDTFSSGTNASPVTWSEPNGTTANTNTGYFGYTTEDSTLCTGTVDRFTTGGGLKWAGTTLNGEEIACSTTPDTGSTPIRVGWAVEVNGYQPPGLYTGTVILIATPTY